MTWYWAKTNDEGKVGISVYDHMMNVGHVARCIANITPELLERFQLTPSSIGALSALHDLGKISPGFQRKCEAWLEENNLVKIDRNGCWDTSTEPDHGKVSHASIQTFLLKCGADRKTAKYVSTVLGAHHGRLNPPNDRGYQPQMAITEPFSGINWDDERISNARKIWDGFQMGDISFSISDDSPALWWLAGLTSVADWIGSDERFFPADRNGIESDRTSAALRALNSIGFRRTEFAKGLSFHDLFHNSQEPEKIWVPNEMQEKTHLMIKGPGVYVIEAPMGMGKTEAALWAAYKLLVAGKALGIYFALPTQATSNRIHLRIDDFISRIAPDAPVSRLIHGNSWLMTDDCGIYPAATDQTKNAQDARTGRDWFASSKRALIAPFGVGTIDQALLGVVAAKHFFVRHFALAGKVVILDEVHSYDLYTGTLIDKLITTLEGLGCTVIILSATLTGKRRRQIVSPSASAVDDDKLPFPLISGRIEGEPLEPLAGTPPESKTVEVEFVSIVDAVAEAISTASKNGVVLWICNTVDSAQEQYRIFAQTSEKAYLVGLLHSRFPFWRREALENEWMGRLDKSGAKRCGCILVSTQIVEQSVDLDADLLISELAPTDMLLQRVGRLWRHPRGRRATKSPKLSIIKEKRCLDEFKILEPDEIVQALGGKAHVYDPFVLLRTLQHWKDYQSVIIPNQIRDFIEATYCDRDDDPEPWQKLFDDRFARNSNERFKAAFNSNPWQPQLPDAEGVQTRLNDRPTVPLILCREISMQQAVFLDGTLGKLDQEKFILGTAQAIHRNLIRVPEYCFEQVEPCDLFSRYLFGSQSIGIVNDSKTVEVHGLKRENSFYYSDEYGLVIERIS